MSVAVIDRNDVVLRGRMAAPAEHRELPSGDTVVSFRLRVRRPEPRARGQSVDVLHCVTFDRALQRRVAPVEPGDVVEVEGALQRRFWRTPHRHGLDGRGELPARAARSPGPQAARASATA